MKRFCTLSAIGALALGHCAHAAITVTVTPPQGGVTYSVDGSNNLTIDATTAANGTVLAITASPDPSDGDYIGNVVINTSDFETHRVFVSINSTSHSGYLNNTGVLGVKDLRRGTGSAEVWLQNAFIRGELGFLTSEGVPTGFLHVNVVSGTVTVRRNILADIVAIGTFEFTPPSGRVINAVIVPVNDDNPGNNNDPFLCHGCDANDQSILGSVRAYGGGIGSISAYNALGFVGEEILSQGPVGSISAGGLAGIFIDMPGYDLGSLVAERGGWGGDDTVDDQGNPGSTLSYPGSVVARSIEEFRLLGDMQSELSVAFGPTGGVWKIGGSLTSTGLLEFSQDQYLKHQIVINEQVDGGTWDSGGQVKVGNNPVYTLDDLYQTVPGVLGGGSVGAAPYRVHTGATVPRPFQTTSYGALDYTSWEYPPPCVNTWGIGIEFYGRVSIASGDQTTAVKVWMGPKNWDGLDPQNPNSPLSSSDITLMPAKSTHTGGRIVTVKRDPNVAWPLDKTYRIEVQPGKIKNLDLVTSSGGSPTFSPQEAYWFKVGDGCRELMDLSMNGSVGGEDAGIWLIDPVDLDGDNVADTTDRDILLRGIDEHGGSED